MGTFRLKFKGLSSLRNKTLFLINMAATIDGFFNTFNTKIEAPVRTHLKSVYACLAMTILSAATGAYTHLFTNLLRGGGFLLSLLGLGCGLGLFMTPDNGKNRLTRFGLLLGFGFFSGAALFAPDGSYLYLGGTLLSGLSTLFWLGFLNLFFQSQLIFQVYLWGGILLFCGFIMWDTQMIIE